MHLMIHPSAQSDEVVVVVADNRLGGFRSRVALQPNSPGNINLIARHVAGGARHWALADALTGLRLEAERK